MAVGAGFAHGLIGVRRHAGALLLAFFTLAAQGQTPPPGAASAPSGDNGSYAAWLAACLGTLGAPSLVERFAHLESPARRMSACRCALGARARAGRAEPEGVASSLRTCIGGAPVAERSPAPQADQLIAELAEAMPAAGPPQGAYRPAEVRFGFGPDSCGPTEYPRAARVAGAEGKVRLAYRVRASGAIDDVVVMKSAGPTREHKLLDSLTVAALKKCPAKPATLDRVPVDSWWEIEFGWQLDR